jgi:hypothetical protein
MGSSRYRPGGMFSLADQEALGGMLAETGFVIERLEPVSLIRRYRDFGEYWSREVDVEIERSTRLRALLTAEAPRPFGVALRPACPATWAPAATRSRVSAWQPRPPSPRLREVTPLRAQT